MTLTPRLNLYLPQDRQLALGRGEILPDRAMGSALFADISGFTPLTEALNQALGPRRGAEELTRHLDAVYTALIAEVERQGGSVISFAGDAITCWFETPGAEWRATVCGLALQTAMQAFTALALPNGATTTLALKVSIASGPARRFVAGDPALQLLDTLAGATLARMAAGEHLAQKGEVVLDVRTVETLGEAVETLEWREGDGEKFAVVKSVRRDAAWANESLSVTNHLLPIAAETLRPWLLAAVYERETSSQGAFLTEFRPAVALFARFVGLDYESDEAGPHLDAWMRRAQNVLARYEGVLLQVAIGDKGSYFYAAFGALTAHEDDARRAVKAALELREAAKAVVSLAPVQIGISRGTMRAGVYGGATRRTYGVLGDEVNLAARLMQTAAPGEILVAGRVQAATPTAFTYEPRPPLPMKGKAEPLPVFAVTGARQSRAIRLQEPTYSLPMVGRQAELQIIADKMDLALQGKGQVVGIVAEAGMGKSRLVAEVIRVARRKGFTGYGGACQSDGVNIPYLAWRPIWSAFFGVDPELPLRKQVRLLEGEIEDRTPERVEALPLLGLVLDLPLPDNDFTRTLDPKARKSALQALLEDCLKSAAREEPLLFVIEDLHWIDALSHDLLEEVARATVALPVCLLLVYRPPELQRLQAPRLEALPHFTRLALPELTLTEGEQALRAKLAQLYPARSGNAPPQLVATLMARAQGNPFYLEELLNYLHDRGLDPLDPAALDKIELPDSLHALVLSRIDQLSEREKTTLKVASVVGRFFHAAWLQGYYPALGELPQVKADLEELSRLDITPLETPEPELAYLFKHIVTREVAYESLAYATRAQLHEQLAQYLEKAYSAAPPLDVLAWHYGRSENTAKQSEYFRKAGDAAQVAYANDVALEYYGRLLPLLVEANAQIEIRLKRSAVLELLGQWDNAEADYRTALSLATGMNDAMATARCQQALGVLFRQRGDYDTALAWLEQAQAGWAALGHQVGASQTVTEIGIIGWRQGEYGMAEQHLNEGRRLAREAGDKLSMALALNWLGNVAFKHSDYTAARALYEESLALRREMGDKRSITASLNNLGNVATNLGDLAAARALHEESLALRREMGDKAGIASSLSNLGAAACEQRDYSAARMLYAESLALFQELGDKWGANILCFNLGCIAIEQQAYASAYSYFIESLRLAREIGDKLYIACNLVGLAGVVVQVGSNAIVNEAHAQSAVRLVAVAESILSAMNGTLEPTERRLYDNTVAAARVALGEEAFTTTWAEGQAMTTDIALDYALERFPL